MHKRILLFLTVLVSSFLLVAASALGADGVPSDSSNLVLPTLQLWAIAVGAIVPLVTYALNHAAPWVSEPAKAFVLVVASAAAGALTQLVDAGDVGFDSETLQVVATAVVGALTAHKLLWRPSEISTRLGGGSNA